jgi:hypothetical protein
MHEFAGFGHIHLAQSQIESPVERTIWRGCIGKVVWLLRRGLCRVQEVGRQAEACECASQCLGFQHGKRSVIEGNTSCICLGFVNEFLRPALLLHYEYFTTMSNKASRPSNVATVYGTCGSNWTCCLFHCRSDLGYGHRPGFTQFTQVSIAPSSFRCSPPSRP